MSFIIEHTTFSFDIFAFLALILLCVTIIYAIVKTNQYKKKEKSLQDELDQFKGIKEQPLNEL